MKEDLLKNPEHIRVCIQYEVLQGKPVFEAYKSFCNILGDDAMEYKEFDYWYYRLLNGNYDLEHDRSEDLKMRELSDMPVGIVEKIFGDLKEDDRLILPNVSKSFRNIIDNSNLLFSELSISMSSNMINLKFNGKEADFSFDSSNEYTLVSSGYYLNRVEEPFVPVVSRVLTRILNKKNLRFGYFEIKFGPYHEHVQQQISMIKDVFEALKSKIHVYRLKLQYNENPQLYASLPYFQPGALQKLYMEALDYDTDFDFLVKTDQFKQAKSFGFIHQSFCAPIETLLHFELFAVDLKRITAEEVVRLKDAFIASPHLKHCLVSYQNRADLVIDLFEMLDWTHEPFPIPGSDTTIDLNFGNSDFELQRIPHVCNCTF